MRILKRLDRYMLLGFLGLFLMTFLICVFVLLMQFVWMHLEDLVGKGVAVSVLAEFFVYAVVTVVPLALPLAILLASLLLFGNLGEQVELTAMKAAGISLFRIMRPLLVMVLCLSAGAFYFSNNILPVSQTKLWTLIFSLREKSPEMEIPEGEFYDGIPGYKLYVNRKDHKSGMLYDMMIYDFSAGFRDAKVMVADSGRIFVTADKQNLLLALYSGESFENLERKQERAYSSRDKIPYRREMFSQKTILIDFSTDFNRYDESVMADQHVSKNVAELLHSIDSVHVMAKMRSTEQSQNLIASHYLGRENHANRQLVESTQEEYAAMSVDSLMARMTPYQRSRAWHTAIDRASSMKDQVEYNQLMLDEYTRYVSRHQIELHRKFTLSFACLIFFFIGAPLGAIIRKGGLGMPAIICVLLFIGYYIIDNTGYKMAREYIWPSWAGMWLSSFVLLPIGIFLTWKAVTDSPLFRPDAWRRQWEESRQFVNTKITTIYEFCRTSFRGLQARSARYRR